MYLYEQILSFKCSLCFGRRVLSCRTANNVAPLCTIAENTKMYLYTLSQFLLNNSIYINQILHKASLSTYSLMPPGVLYIFVSLVKQQFACYACTSQHVFGPLTVIAYSSVLLCLRFASLQSS